MEYKIFGGGIMNITNIDVKVRKALQARIVELSKEVIKKEYGLDLSAAGGTYARDGGDYTMKLFIVVPATNLAPTKVDAESIKQGLAPRGTPVTVNGKRYTVVKARQTKYIIESPTGEQYLARFTSCQPSS
jgi:hypothetical protein